MDNKIFDITAVGDRALNLALAIAFEDGWGGDRIAKGYEVKDNTLIFYWTEHQDATKPLYPIKHEHAVGMTTEWLKTVKPTEREPDIDGDIDQGFRVYCEDWGHVNGRWQAFVAIKPIWAYYGK